MLSDSFMLWLMLTHLVCYRRHKISAKKVNKNGKKKYLVYFDFIAVKIKRVNNKNIYI